MSCVTSSRQFVTAFAVALAALAVALAGPTVSSAAPAAKPESAGSNGSGSGTEKGPPQGAVGNDKSNAKAGSGEGIVQSVSPATVVLRALDGSATSVPVSNATHVFVDGRRASLVDVEPGLVALAVWNAGKSAKVLQAFDLAGPNAVRVGIVKSVSARTLVVTQTGGTTLSIAVNAKTRVLVDGRSAKLADVKDGYTVVIGAKGSKKAAHELRFLRAG